MREINLEPNWVNLGKYMAQALKDNSFISDEVKENFSEQYSLLLGHVNRTNPDGWKELTRYHNMLADGGFLVICNHCGFKWGNLLEFENHMREEHPFS